MADLITIDEVRIRIGDEILLRIAGVGSHNATDGRARDEVKISAAIKFASDVILGYLAKIYPKISTMNVATTPDLIKGYASDIIHYRLRGDADNRSTQAQDVRKRFEDAESYLSKVARGLVRIDGLQAFAEGGKETGLLSPSAGVAYIPPARADDILDGY